VVLGRVGVSDDLGEQRFRLLGLLQFVVREAQLVRRFALKVGEIGVGVQRFEPKESCPVRVLIQVEIGHVELTLGQHSLTRLQVLSGFRYFWGIWKARHKVGENLDGSFRMRLVAVDGTGDLLHLAQPSPENDVGNVPVRRMEGTKILIAIFGCYEIAFFEMRVCDLDFSLDGVWTLRKPIAKTLEKSDRVVVAFIIEKLDRLLVQRLVRHKLFGRLCATR